VVANFGQGPTVSFSTQSRSSTVRKTQRTIPLVVTTQWAKKSSI
jgi:hypothetical protein